MAQFDVYRLRGGELVLDWQSDLLADLPSRFVVPLRPADPAALERLTPRSAIKEQTVTMLTPLARGIARRGIISTVATLASEQDQIKRELDMLVSGI